MKHILEFKSYINESEDPSGGPVIMDYIRNSEDGKFLQTLVANGRSLPIEDLFKAVKTGRVYIKGAYAGSTRLYKYNNQWCQISESSGNTYGYGCFDTLEELIKYSITRFILLRKERGLREGDLERWIKSNWDKVIKMNNAKEIIGEYKSNSELSSMITDPEVLNTLPTYKEFQDVFFNGGKIYEYTDSIINADPFNLYGMDGFNFESKFRVKLTNKEGYSAKQKMSWNPVEISIGTSSIEKLDELFRKGLIYAVNKKYESLLKRENSYAPTTDLLVPARDLYIAILSNGAIGDVEKLLIALRKLKEENPLALGKIVKYLRKSNPKTLARFEEEFGSEEAKDIEKGSSILNRFGI
jgi:hypothetical protein